MPAPFAIRYSGVALPCKLAGWELPHVGKSCPQIMSMNNGPLRVGVGGPVGSGKTALMDGLCKRLRERYQIAAITNDIYTKWDAEYLVRSGALEPERIAGVERRSSPSASPASRPAAARTPRSARMRPPISPRSPTCGPNSPASTWC